MSYGFSRRLRAIAPHLAAILLFTGLVVVHTWPAARDIRGNVIMGRDDVWMNIWHMWWLKESLWVHPQNPFHCDLIAWPEGTDLYWHTLSPAKNGLGALLSVFFSYGTAYNLVILSAFVATGYTTWLLLRWLLNEANYKDAYADIAAAAGASLFAFSRYHLGQGLTHINLTGMEGIPLFLLGFLGWSKHGKLRYLALVAASVLYIALCEYYYVCYVAVFAAMWVVAERWHRGSFLSLQIFRDITLRRQIIAGAVSAVVLAPILWMLVTHMGNLSASQHGDTDYYGDAVGFLLPDVTSAWLPYLPGSWQTIMQQVGGRTMFGNIEEGAMFLGWLSLLIPIFVGFRNRFPHARRWLLIAAVFVVLACGKELSIAGTTRISPAWLLLATFLFVTFFPALRRTSWHRDVVLLLAIVTVWAFAVPFTAEKMPFTITLPMPYIVFKSVVPLFSKAGMPVRLASMATLCFAVLYAFFGMSVVRALGSRSYLALPALLVLIAIPNVEFLSYTWPMRPVPENNDFFRRIRADKENTTVMSDGIVSAQFDQTLHGHPITGARLSRTPEPVVQMRSLPVFQALESLRRIPTGYSDNEVEVMRNYLITNHIKYYTFHPQNPQGGMRESYHRPNVDTFITTKLGGRKVYENDYIVGYQFY